MINTLLDEYKRFIKLESAGGITLLIAAIFAIIFANTGLSVAYDRIIELPVKIQIGEFEIAKPLLLWINDGLMAIFFFLVGLELKREFLEGELSNPTNLILPGLGALGGMLVPALIYLWFNHDDPIAVQGWAIPAATDIAFSLGILMLLGSRVPLSLKVFLVTLAIFDDVGAIIIIALFYTSQISMEALITAVVCLGILAALNKKGVADIPWYVFIGIVMWAALLKSGVHATLAGIALAFCIPMRDSNNPDYSPVKHLEHSLHGFVAFVVLPLFAFVNAGISFAGVTTEQLFHNVPLGIWAGLFIGKPIGILGFISIAVLFKWVKLPSDINWGALFGLSLLCGIGFTMSLFIGGLAFEEAGFQDIGKLFDERLGILFGSLMSGIAGFIILKLSLKNNVQPTNN